MRLGRAAFWPLISLNIAVAALGVTLLPAGLSFARPAVHGFPMSPLPLEYVVACALCLPSIWLGALRLHDVGQRGWHAWPPLLAAACVTFVPQLLRPYLLDAVIWGQTHAQTAPVGRIGMAIMIAGWLGALLLAAGTLRTVFLWLQPSEAKDNRYGPAPENIPAPALKIRPETILPGRLARLPFLLLLVANVVLVYGVNYLLDQWPDFLPRGGMLRSAANMLLYLPAFAASVPRLHDLGQTAILPSLVFTVGIASGFAERFLSPTQINGMNVVVDILTIYLLFQCWQPGDADANRYGPPPGSTPHPVEPAPPRIIQPQTRSMTGNPAAPQGFGRRRF